MKKAFTLAEVLITLAIIGVIAAISVPSLIQKTNQAELITAFKKEYATLSQAADNLLFDEAGGTFKGFGASAPAGTYEDFLANAFSNKLKVIKKCYENSSTNCWHGAYSTKLKWYDGTTGSNINEIFSHASIILNNGSMVSFGGGYHLPQCDPSATYPTYTGFTETKYCLFMSVDVNGFKNPNQYGKDVYFMMLTPDGIQIPEKDNCNASGSTTEARVGYSCAQNALYSK